MSSLLTSDFWDYFNTLESDKFDTFGNEEITFKHQKYNMDYFQEDGGSQASYSTYTLRCLMNYNYYRVWGVNKNSQSGEKESSSIVAIIGKKYLIDTFTASGIVDANGNLLFDSNKDFFIHKGLRYTAQGDTFLSQNSSNPNFFMIILQRDKRFTGEEKGQQT